MVSATYSFVTSRLATVSVYCHSHTTLSKTTLSGTSVSLFSNNLGVDPSNHPHIPTSQAANMKVCERGGGLSFGLQEQAAWSQLR